MNKKINYIVGIITTVMILTTAGVIVWKSQAFSGEKGYTVIGEFNNIKGITKGTIIQYNGYTIGQVKTINFNPETIKVYCFIKEQIKIPKESTLEVDFDGLIGTKYLKIKPAINSKEYLSDGDTITGSSIYSISSFINAGTKTLQNTTEITDAIKKLLIDDNGLNSMKNTINSFKNISKKVDDLTNTLNNSINKNRMENIMNNLDKFIENLEKNMSSFTDQKVITDIKTTSSQLAEMTKRLNTMSTDIQQNVSTKQNYQNINDIIENLKQFTEKLNNFMDADGLDPKNANTDKRGDKPVIGAIANLKIRGENNIQFAPNESTMKYYTQIDMGYLDYFYRLAFGYGYIKDKTGLLHIQQVVPLDLKTLLKVGIMYEKPGIGIDYKYNNKLLISMDLFNNEDPEAALGVKYIFTKRLDVTLSLMRNPDQKKAYNNYMIGLSYHL